MLRGGAKISTQGTLQSSTIWGSQLLLSTTIARGKEALVGEECNFSSKYYVHFKLAFHTQERQPLILPTNVALYKMGTGHLCLVVEGGEKPKMEG